MNFLYLSFFPTTLFIFHFPPDCESRKSHPDTSILHGSIPHSRCCQEHGWFDVLPRLWFEVHLEGPVVFTEAFVWCLSVVIPENFLPQMIITTGDQHSKKWSQESRSRELKAVKMRVLKIKHSPERGAKGGL